ncbi:hypothetical protein ABZX40_37335 [Streptomyces sp. NPDC004610]|uniref:hypothetical protein n=1 Tax=unclassified Streptomyces TaxID=2593676 RepID=UPI0033BD7C58
MTPQQTSAPAYLAALRARLEADHCAVSSTHWHGHEVVVGERTDRKARWLGSGARIFVHAAAVPVVDEAALAEFSDWAMAAAGHRISGISVAFDAGLVLPALISADVRPAAAQWAAREHRVRGMTVVGRPIAVAVTEHGPRTAMFRGRGVAKAMFAGHVRDKAALYFP